MNKIIINIKFAIAVILTTMLFVGTHIEVSAQTLVLKKEGVFITSKVHIKSVWEKNEESLLVVSYFPHFG